MSATTPLFRAEVLHAQQAQWLGSIRVAQRPAFAWVAATAMVLAALLLGYAWWGEVTRKASLAGVLLPEGGLAHVGAAQAGVVSELLVREGDGVERGQPIARLRSERRTDHGDALLLARHALEQRRSALEAERRIATQQGQARQDALVERLRSLRAEAHQAEAELEAQQQRVQIGAQRLSRDEALAREGFVSAAQVQQRVDERIELQARERNARRQLAAARRDIAELQAESATQRHATLANLAQLDQRLAALDQERTELEARGELLVTAPEAGRVTALVAHAGQSLQPGQTIASITPSGAAERLVAQLYAPSRTAGFVQPGQAVWLRYAAYPYQKFGMHRGTVQSVSQSPIAAPDLPAGQAQALLSAAQAREPLYRVTVALAPAALEAYGHPIALRPGLALEADVVLERRAVWEWLLEPVIAVRQRTKILNASPTSAEPTG
ncbi:MAG: HlyD family efflux transporter periplasmic adaptor subunit [Aquabacterium sp.]|nr:HlyD family efflux transporter periplasmic adaptor subunit [Aquabacterium sp.]